LLIPQIIDASVKIAIAVENTVRAPSRSAIHPLTGMNTGQRQHVPSCPRLRSTGCSE
jgi:hypothetical protein